MNNVHKSVFYQDFGEGVQPYFNVEVNDDIEYEIEETKEVIKRTKLLPMPMNNCPFCGAKLE